MKKVVYALLVLLVVISGLVFANRTSTNEIAAKSIPKPVAPAGCNTAMKEWEATPAGLMYKKWEAFATGKKVYAAEATIIEHINAFTNMEAVVTFLSLPPGSRLGFGVMVKINGEDYILGYGPEKLNESQQLHTLKVADKIIIRSHSLLHAPKYSFPIISINYIERDGKIIFKTVPRKDGC